MNGLETNFAEPGVLLAPHKSTLLLMLVPCSVRCNEFPSGKFSENYRENYKRKLFSLNLFGAIKNKSLINESLQGLNKYE